MDAREPRDGGGLGLGSAEPEEAGIAAADSRFLGGAFGLGSAPPDGFGGGSCLPSDATDPNPPRKVAGAPEPPDEGMEPGEDVLPFLVSPSKTSRSLPLSSAMYRTPHDKPPR
ncbi:MAG: hypothetical protein DRI90_23210 [Deltaproteobacteria bacterium]|nr:MAG: hypothetical protein DRI90_23210 [Deltaproteobacteria bacterium]